MEDNVSKDQQKIVELLQKVGQSEVVYPAELLEKRRKAFLGLVAGITIGTVAHEGFIQGLKNIKLPAKDALIQLILGTTLVAEIAISAYVFRDKIRDFFKKDPPTPAIIVPAKINTVTSIAAESPESSTETPVPTSTFMITVAPQKTSVPGEPSVVSVPTEQLPTATEIPSTKPGKHLGQTPAAPPGQEATPTP